MCIRDRDTVQPFNEFEKTGNGFSFTNYNSDEMMTVLEYAVHLYYESRDDWRKLVQNAMNTDVSWEHSANNYMQLYHELNNR